MKIKITYEKGERISEVMIALEKLFPDGKWDFSDRHSPFFHAYFNIPRYSAAAVEVQNEQN